MPIFYASKEPRGRQKSESRHIFSTGHWSSGRRLDLLDVRNQTFPILVCRVRWRCNILCPTFYTFVPSSAPRRGFVDGMCGRHQPVTRILLDAGGNEVGDRKDFNYFFGGGLFLKQSGVDTKRGKSSSAIQSPSSMFFYLGCEEAYFFKRFEKDCDSTIGKFSKLLCPTRVLSSHSAATARPTKTGSRISCTTHFQRRNPAISFDSISLERRSILFPGRGVKKERVQKIMFVFESEAWEQASKFHQSIALLCMHVERVLLSDSWTRCWQGISNNRTQSHSHDAKGAYRAEVCFRIDLDRFEETVDKPHARDMWYGIVCKRFGPFRFTARASFARCPDLSKLIHLAEQQNVLLDQLEKLTRLVHMIHIAQVNSEFDAPAQDERCRKCKRAETAEARNTLTQNTAHCIHSASELASKLAVLFDLQCRVSSQSFFTVFADKLGLLTGTYFLDLSLAGQRSCYMRMKDRMRNATKRFKRSSLDATVERGGSANGERAKRRKRSLCESMLPEAADSSVLAELYDTFAKGWEGNPEILWFPDCERSESGFAKFLIEDACNGPMGGPSSLHGFSPTQQ